MKSLIAIFLTALCLFQCNVGGNELETKPEAATIEAPKNWKKIEIETADLALSLPPEFNKKDSRSESKRNGEVAWTSHYYSWSKTGEPRFEVDVSVTDWDKDFKKIVPDLTDATPELLLKIDVAADRRHKQTDSSPVEESAFMELDGIKGGFFRARRSDGENRIFLGWYAYRRHKGKSQKISINIEGVRGDLKEMTAVINSAKFKQK